MGELRPHQDELSQLAELAGIQMHKEVFRSLVRLLNMGFSPTAIFKLLKNMKKRTEQVKLSKKPHTVARTSVLKR